MIKQILLVVVLALAQAGAFVPIQPAVDVAVAAQQQPQVLTSSQDLQQGVNRFLMEEPKLSSSTVTLSLQERKIPTPEEIAAKKRNFNLWFWGGGFVAPFLATFYYFGFKFWEK